MILTFKDKVYLAALLQDKLSEDGVIKEVKLNTRTLAPTNQLKTKILAHLLDRGIISPVGDEVEFDIFKVDYKVNDDIDIEDILKLSFKAKKDSDVLELWRDIAYAEICQQLEHRANMLGYTFREGKETKQLLNNMLDFNSVLQCTYIINAVTKRKGKYPGHAGVVTQLKSYFHQCFIAGWDISETETNYEQTWISKVFAKASELNDYSRTMPIDVESIKEVKQLRTSSNLTNNIYKRKDKVLQLAEYM